MLSPSTGFFVNDGLKCNKCIVYHGKEAAEQGAVQLVRSEKQQGWGIGTVVVLPTIMLTEKDHDHAIINHENIISLLFERIYATLSNEVPQIEHGSDFPAFYEAVIYDIYL